MDVDDHTSVYVGNVTVPTSGGYTCGVCGHWVDYGKYHVCGGDRELSWTTTTTAFGGPDLARIAAALERIADALEKIK